MTPDLFGYPASDWMPVVFAGLMGFSILVYVILDGYDLGIGGLFPLASPEERDRMVASIGPFWDANETWLVLAVGILLVAFPTAHGEILTALYLPVVLMLIGLILRGVAFEFRMKDSPERKWLWDATFWAGSSIASLTQGYMLGLYIMGLETSLEAHAFAVLTSVGLAAAYGFLGAGWLIIKTEDALRNKALVWSGALAGVGALGLVAISVATPLVNERLFDKWFSWPSYAYLSPLPLASLAAIVLAYWSLSRLRRGRGQDWHPFALASALCIFGFIGMAYSFFPYVVPEQTTIWQAAAAPESLGVMLIGICFVFPVIIAYTVFSYFVFSGKARSLTY